MALPCLLAAVWRGDKATDATETVLCSIFLGDLRLLSPLVCSLQWHLHFNTANALISYPHLLFLSRGPPHGQTLYSGNTYRISVLLVASIIANCSGMNLWLVLCKKNSEFSLPEECIFLTMQMRLLVFLTTGQVAQSFQALYPFSRSWKQALDPNDLVVEMLVMSWLLLRISILITTSAQCACDSLQCGHFDWWLLNSLTQGLLFGAAVVISVPCPFFALAFCAFSSAILSKCIQALPLNRDCRS